MRAFLRRVQPLSLCALLATLLLFGFQGDQLIHQPAAIAPRAVPILIQVYPNSGGTTRGTGSPVSSIASQGLQRCSALLFKLAVAVAAAISISISISIFCFRSGAALATVVGVLIEVPLMLSIVAIANRSRG